MNSKADIAITTIFVLVITVISIFLLLTLFAYKIPFFSKDLYCKTFYHIQKATFVPSGLRADQTYCKETEALTVMRGNSSNAINETAAAVVGCYQAAAFGKASRPVICTHIMYFANETVELTEANITKALYDNGVCDIVPNNESDPNCGKDDVVDFARDPIKLYSGNQTSVLVEYDNTTRHVVVS